MNSDKTARVVFCFLVLFVFSLLGLFLTGQENLEKTDIKANYTHSQPEQLKIENPSKEASVLAKAGRLATFKPSGFLENKGQWENDQVLFFLDKGGLHVTLGTNNFAYTLNYRESTSSGDQFFRHTIGVELVGANPNPGISKAGKSKDYRNFFLGARQASSVHHYSRVTYHDIYPGVDMVLEAHETDQRRLGFKYSFVVHPGADPDQIRLKYDGQDGMASTYATNETRHEESDKNQSLSNLLSLTTRGGKIGEELSEVYTLSDGIRNSIEAKFQLLGGDQVKYDLGAYDQSEVLVIDPDVVIVSLRTSTYYGSNDKEQLTGIDSDSDGNIVVVGVTEDNQSFRMSLNGFQNDPNSGNEIIVAKFTEDLTTLLSATYLGGDEDDQAFDVAVDATNSVSITGYSASSNFLGYTNEGATDIIVANLSADLGSLNWVYGLGGANSEGGNTLEALDGSLYIAATAGSSDLNTIGPSYNGEVNEALFVKLDVADGTLDWSTYNGDSEISEGNGLAVTDSEVIVAGKVFSNVTFADVTFIAKYNTSGAKLMQETFGARNIESVNDLAVSTNYNKAAIVGSVTGRQGNNDASFQNTTHQSNYAGGASDGYLIQINTSDLSLDWSTYYGGVASFTDRKDELISVIYDCNQNIITSGYSTSPNGISDNGFINDYQGGAQNATDFGDAIMVKLDSTGSRYWGSYFGEGGNESGQAIALSSTGNIVLCGITSSEGGIATDGSFDDIYDQNNKTGDVGFISTFCDLIFTGPQNASTTVGNDATFTSTLDYCGADNALFSWTKDGNTVSDGDVGFGIISNSATAQLEIAAVSDNAAGSYCVTVSTACGTRELCATLEVNSLEGTNVCLDSLSTLGSAGANQETIELTFPNLEDNASITDASYRWSVTAVSGDVNGANEATDGAAGSFPATLPLERDDLNNISITPTVAGTYIYRLDLTYEDDRRDPTTVTDFIETTVEVYEFPSFTGITPTDICEDETSTVSFTTDIDIRRVEYERIDTNAGLTGHETGDQTGINAVSFDLSFDDFSNTTNQALDAEFEITPYTSNNCAGPVWSFTITVSPNPELDFTNVTDTICNGTAVNIDFAALTSPNYQANGGTSISWTRVENTNISPDPSVNGPFNNSGTVNEVLTNNSAEIQTVTYTFDATYLGCEVPLTQQIQVLPDIALDHSENITQEICSGDGTTLAFGLALSGIDGEISLDFTDNPNVTGDDDATLMVAADETESFPVTLTTSGNVTETVTATVTPTAFLDGGATTCDGVSQTFTFNVQPIPSINNASETICENIALNIDLDALSNGITGTSYIWTAVNGTGNITGFSDDTGNVISETLVLSDGETEGTVTYTVTPTTGAGCAGTPGTITVSVLGEPDISLTADPSAEVCSTDGDPVTITATVTGTDTGNITGYTWSKDGTEISGETSDNISVDEPGVYTVDVASTGGCSIPETITISEVIRAEVSIDPSPTGSLCVDGDFTLTAVISSGTANEYQWLLDGAPIAGASSQTYDANLDGDYQVTVNGSTTCPSTSAAVTLSFFPPAVPNFSVDPDERAVCPNTTLSLTGENSNAAATIDDISWTVTGDNPLPTFSDASSFNTDLIFSENQTDTDRTYTINLTLTTSDGCDSTYSENFVHQARPLVDFTFADENCSGEVTLATQNTSGATTYNWELLSATSGLTITDPTLRDPNFKLVNDTGDTIFHELRLIAANANSCSDTLVQTLNSYPDPEMFITGSLEPICNGEGIALSSATSTAGDGLTFTERRWTVNGENPNLTENLTTNLVNTGVTDSLYQIILTGTHDAGCQSSDTVEITVYPDARAELELLNGNTTEACVPIVINASVIGLVDYPDANTADYLWEVDSAGTIVATSTGSVPPSYQISEPEISVDFRLTAYSRNGCVNDQDVITFTSFPESIAAFTPSTLTACEEETVTFTNTSTNASDFDWDFGDGTTSSDPSPEHAFDNPSFTENAVYTVTLTTTSVDGCSDTESIDITVWPLPNAAFDVSGGCGGAQVQPTNNSEGQGTLTYRWSTSNTDVISFDDTSLETPRVTFVDEPALGDRDAIVFLTVTSVNGCQTTSQQTVQVISRPQAALSFDPVQCLTDAVFTNTSTTASDLSSISTLILDYGDGGDETLNAPFSEISHNYSDTGTYVLQIQAISADGCSDTADYSIRMIDVPVPVVASTQDPLSGCGPDLEVDFDGSSSTLYGFETYQWDFGNGNTDTDLNPAVQFFAQDDTTEIIYDVTFTINSSLCDNAEATTSVLVKPSPTAVLESSTIVGCDDVEIQFFNESQGVFIDEIDTMYWDFGDGTTSTKFDLEVFPYTYQNDGFEDTTFTVQLIAANACGRDTTTRDITIQPFNEDPNIFLEDLDALYCTVDTISAEIVGLGGDVGRNIRWFLSGEELAFQDESITFPAPAAGNYELVLQVDFPICGGSDFDTVRLEVQAGPEIDFELSSDELCFGDTLTITNTGAIQSSQTSWNLGDGSGAFSTTEPEPFVYDSSGTFSIAMYLEDENDCPTEVSRDVVVAEDIIPAFTVLNQPLCSSDSIVLENTTQGAQSFRWTVTLEDTTYTSTNRTDRFPPSGATGPVIIRLEAYQEAGFAGCVEIKTETFTILESPIASFIPSELLVCQGDLITFENASIGATGYEWTFEGDSMLTEANPEFAFTTTGIQDVTLTAISSAGCRKDTTVRVEIVPKPDATFAVNMPACTGEQLGIVNNSTEASGYQWLVLSGVGDTLSRSTEFVPFVVINDPGLYEFSLEAFNETNLEGCSSREEQSITINQTPIADFDILEQKVCEDSLITIVNSSRFSERNIWRLQDDSGDYVDSIGITNDNSTVTYRRTNNLDNVAEERYDVQLETIGQGGCKAFDNQELIVISNPDPIFAVDQDPICGGIAFDLINTTILTTEDGLVHNWFKDGLFLESSYSISPALSRVERPVGKDTLVNFELQVTNDICFGREDTTLVVPGFYGCDIAMANAFSPNGDGLNDVFEVRINPLDYDNFTFARISVFTTTESQVFQLTMQRDSVSSPMTCEGCSEEYDPDLWYQSLHWDGSIQGQITADNRDAYFYRVEVRCCDNEPPPITGYVQLIR